MNQQVYRIADKYIAVWIPIGVLLILGSTVIFGLLYFDETPTDSEPVVETESESVTVDLQSQSEVTNDTELFNEGEVISSPIYLSSTNPTLDLVYNIESDREVAVEEQISVNIVGQQDDFRFWDQRITVRERQYSTQSESTSASINITKIRNNAFQVREQFSQRGEIIVTISFGIDYNTDTYSGQINREMQLIFRDDTYSVTPPDFTETSTNRFDVEVGEREVGDERYVNAGIGLLVAGVVLILIRIFVADPNRVRKDYEMAKFGDWISSCADNEQPDEQDSESISLLTLEDLIDVAADTEERSIYYPNKEKVVVYEEKKNFEYNFTEKDLSKVRWNPIDRIFGNEDTEDDNSE